MHERVLSCPKDEPFKTEHQTEAQGAWKCPAQTNPLRKKTVPESSPQHDEEEEESKPTLVYRKRKLPDQACPQVGVVLFLEFSLALDVILT